MNKIALNLVYLAIWLRKKLLIGLKLIGFLLTLIGKFTFLPFILFVYKNILRFKIKTKKIEFSEINYLPFIKKYLPRLVMLLIITVVTTNNILAQSYNTEEYASRTLISTVITKDEATWSEIIEEKAPVYAAKPNISNYVEEMGNIQQLVIITPFENDDEDIVSNTSADDSSLVLLAPKDTESVQLENNDTTVDRSKAIEYIVQPGDVLGKIAEEHGLSVNTILWENNLTWRSTIKPGQKLILLPKSGINYEIKSGDTVLAIAKKYQTEASKIISINKLADSSDIQIGDLLFIPDGVKPTQVVSSYKAKATVAISQPAPSNAGVINTGTKLLWPTLSHRITQYYHYAHSGLDIGDKTGNPIYAAEAGKVERSGWSRGYGYNVVINHGNGIKTLYGHSSKLLVSVGDSVSRGQTIALIGNTGWSTGPHLHMEVRVNNVKKNPLNYIK